MITTPASRTSDPITSHEAEAEINKSGKRAQQQEAVLAMLKRNEGCTSYEIAVNEGADRYMVARRLSELAGVYAFTGKPRLCRASGNKRRAMPWYSK